MQIDHSQALAPMHIMTRLSAAMTAPMALDDQMPQAILGIKKAVQEEAKALKNKSIINSFQTGFQSTRLCLNGPTSKGLTVVVSFLLYQEETYVVVFEDLSQPLGKDTTTRHYQPTKYLGNKSAIELMAHVNELKAQATLKAKSQEDLDKKLKEIDQGIGVNPTNSNHYALPQTRLPLEQLHVDIFNYLSTGEIPKAYKQ